MKGKMNCKIVQDLLPNYVEKLTSEETNSFIDEHLKECENCKSILKNMNKNINLEEVINQDEKIDYLKGYRKNKIKTIIFVILLTIIIMLSIFITLFIFEKNSEFFADVNDINIECTQKSEYGEKTEITFAMTSQKYDLKFYQYEEISEENKGKNIYLKTVGKYPFSNMTARCYWTFDIDETTNRIYIEDKKGNLKEIWNKNTGIMVHDASNSYYIKINNSI